MALVKCGECGSDVSDLAKSCPKCGAPVAAGAAAPPKDRVGGCMAVILSIVAIVILIVIFSSGKTPSDTQPAGEGSSSTTSSTSSSTSGNPAQDRLIALSESERNTLLASLMQSSGERCRSVTRSMYQGQDSDRNAYWSLACANRRRDYQLQIHADANGSTRFVECDLVRAIVGRSGCWKAF